MKTYELLNVYQSEYITTLAKLTELDARLAVLRELAIKENILYMSEIAAIFIGSCTKRQRKNERAGLRHHRDRIHGKRGQD